MQEYKDNKIIEAVIAKKKSELTDKAKVDLESGRADRVVIAEVQIGDEFELKGLRFRVQKFRGKRQIVAKLIGGEN